MTHYNFYSDHVEVVSSGSVFYDSRKDSFFLVCKSLTFDLKTSDYFSKNSRKAKQIVAIISLINSVLLTSEPSDPINIVRLRNIFLAVGRFKFGHCFVHFIY